MNEIEGVTIGSIREEVEIDGVMWFVDNGSMPNGAGKRVAVLMVDGSVIYDHPHQLRWNLPFTDPTRITHWRYVDVKIVDDNVGDKKHNHYFKDVSHLGEIDVYRTLALFGVKDQAIGHAVKKLLVSGGRGGGKTMGRDVSEAIDTLRRWEEMQAEDTNN